MLCYLGTQLGSDYKNRADFDKAYGPAVRQTIWRFMSVSRRVRWRRKLSDMKLRRNMVL
jgi:hypothetical protein